MQGRAARFLLVVTCLVSGLVGMGLFQVVKTAWEDHLLIRQVVAMINQQAAKQVKSPPAGETGTH